MAEEQKNSKTAIFVVVVILALVALTFYLYAKRGGLELQNENPKKYDEFAQCLVSAGAKFYGAWWCPHCQDQKDAFGDSWAIFLDGGGYIECANEDKSTIEFCSVQGITAYPTWVFNDGLTLGGKQEFTTLAEKTGCALP